MTRVQVAQPDSPEIRPTIRCWPTRSSCRRCSRIDCGSGPFSLPGLIHRCSADAQDSLTEKIERNAARDSRLGPPDAVDLALGELSLARHPLGDESTDVD